MSSKVLLADDSLTIQKVVSITFTNEPLELTTCNNHEELEAQLKSGEYDLLLLDFNLDEGKSGYDLCSMAKEISPNINVIILYGTFDTIVEEQLKEHKVDAHIVKPFDGGKFLTLCKDILNSNKDEKKNSLADIKIVDTNPNIKNEIQASNDAEDENWNISENVTEASSSELTSTTEISREEKSQLLRDVESWGIDVPPIISDFESADDFAVEFPPVINGQDNSAAETFNIELGQSQELNALSSQAENELESAVYDDIDEETNDEGSVEESASDPVSEVLSEMTVEEVQDDESDNISLVDVSGEAEDSEELELETNAQSVEDNFIVQESSTEEQELTNEDLWADDEDYEPESGQSENTPVEENVVEQVNNEVEMELQPVDELEIEQKDDPSSQTKITAGLTSDTEEDVEADNAKKDVSGFVQLDLADTDEEGTGELQLSDHDILEDATNTGINESTPAVHVDGSSQERSTLASSEEIRAMVEEVVRDVVKEELNKVFSSGVDKVAWEIIPDLAENLIKNQLQSISDKILEE